MPLTWWVDVRPGPSRYLAASRRIPVRRQQHIPHQVRMCDLQHWFSTLGPHTDPTAMILTEGEVGNLNSMDWQEPVTLYDIHAPISVARSKEPLTDVSTDPFTPAPAEEMS